MKNSNRNTVFNLLIALGLILLLGGGILMARQTQAQGAGPLGPSSPQDSVGTAFTYQGRLLSSATPVNGTCDFRFNLYNDAWFSPSLVEGPVDRSGVTVSDGYFSTSLDFGASAFTGEGRQLQILVRCPAGSGGYTTLSGMVTLSAAPYALSLQPGAIISGSLEMAPVVKAENTYAGMLISYGLQGVSQAIGVLGTGGAAGVQGETATASGKGVYGEATASSGTNYGVYGETNSTSGHGVYGTSPSTDTIYAGVTGVNTGGGVGSGVYGYSVGGYGVRGLSTVGVGVHGAGSTYGVYGKANSWNGYGVYSEGDAHVEGKLTWRTYTSYLSIPAAALQPGDEADNWTLVDAYFYSEDDAYYIAPVYLPHGALVTEIKTWWSDSSAEDASLELKYVSPDYGGSTALATLTTTGSTGTVQESVYTSQSGFALIDNSMFSYILYLDLPDSNIYYYQTVIEYTTTGP